MKIIRTGKAPSEIDYKHTCISCGTIFLFTLAEIKQEYDQRENDQWYTCYCPHNPCSQRQIIRKLEPYKVSNVDPY